MLQQQLAHVPACNHRCDECCDNPLIWQNAYCRGPVSFVRRTGGLCLDVCCG
jgi:hypothetical protein